MLEDSFHPQIPLQYYDIFLSIGQELGFDPSTPKELEAYCNCLLAEFQKTRNEDFREWVWPRLVSSFVCLSKRPAWIQDPQWQVSDGRPMVFVGQLDVQSESRIGSCPVSFYVFYDPEKGDTRVVRQVG
jgi:hypothetical protein